MNELIYLLSETFESDEIGNDISAKSARAVWGEVDSVSQSEFNTAAQNGLNPKLRFRIWYHEYSGEKKVRFKGENYKIYRTFKTSDLIELYAEGEDE